jgi:hypothetical protein
MPKWHRRTRRTRKSHHALYKSRDSGVRSSVFRNTDDPRRTPRNSGNRKQRSAPYKSSDFGTRSSRIREFFGFRRGSSVFQTTEEPRPKTTEFERGFRQDAPEKVKNGVVRVLRCGFGVLTIGDLIAQPTAHGGEMQNARAIREQRFPAACTPADCGFPIGEAGRACQRCGAPSGRHGI